MALQDHRNRLKVAIIGCGPAGLGAAIQLARLPFVDWDLYEKRTHISDIGGGFTLQPQTWWLLEQNGASYHMSPKDYFRSPEGQIEQRRNGRTGELLLKKYSDEDLPRGRQSCRLARAKLQAALFKCLDHNHVHFSKRLVDVQQLQCERICLWFEGHSSPEKVDLLIAADGIRSVIRKAVFPGHTLQYNGQSVYRTIISKSKALNIEGIPQAPTFWKHVSGLYVFTCPLGDDDFEVTARIRKPISERDAVIWGRPFDLRTILHAYDDFCRPVRLILRLAADGDTQEFALFSGPRPDRMVSNGNIAFVGDACHALLGNFGSGAGFALEDVYALTRALEWSRSRKDTLRTALELFNAIRSPHYERLYGLIDKFATIKDDVRKQDLPLDEEIAERVKRVSLACESWMFYYDIEHEVSTRLHEVKEHGVNEQKVSTEVVKTNAFDDERTSQLASAKHKFELRTKKEKMARRFDTP